ncbi:hypothetical protein C3L33_12650, partial [Rhododendron williamsianum]
MGDSTRKIDVQKLIAFGNDLVGCLKEEKDVKNLTQHMELSKALQSHCNGDSKAVHNLRQAVYLCYANGLMDYMSIRDVECEWDIAVGSPSYIIDNLFLASDYRKKIDLSKKKADDTKSEAVADVEMDFLQKELAVSNMINTVITNQIGDLELQGVSVEERRQLLKKLEQEELRTQ